MTTRRLLQLEDDLREMVQHLDALERGQYRLVRDSSEATAPERDDIIITHQVIERERRVVDAFRELIEKMKTAPVEDDVGATTSDSLSPGPLHEDVSREHGVASADTAIAREDAPKSYSCHKCGMPMRVGVVEPDGPDREKRIFECIGCKESKTVVVRSS